MYYPWGDQVKNNKQKTIGGKKKEKQLGKIQQTNKEEAAPKQMLVLKH